MWKFTVYDVTGIPIMQVRKLEWSDLVDWLENKVPFKTMHSAKIEKDGET